MKTTSTETTRRFDGIEEEFKIGPWDGWMAEGLIDYKGERRLMMYDIKTQVLNFG